MELLLKYFPNLTEQQIEQFEVLLPLYKDWNAKINVISRKDIDELYLRHVLHSLAIAKVMPFTDDSLILDVVDNEGGDYSIYDCSNNHPISINTVKVET